LYFATELERVAIIRQGVPAISVVQIGRAMDMTKDLLYSTLALPRSTMVRKIQNNETLSAEQSERVVGLERLVGQVEAMVNQSGNPEGFDAGRWVGDWLQRPLPALGGKKPAEFMDTMEGQNLVARFLAQSQSGAYA
jgi:putative toxin-antitoxin system antitoxin component (TIGR02293 family)